MSDPDKFSQAANYLLPRVKERMVDGGAAWYTRQDTHEVMEKFGIDRYTAGQVYSRLAGMLGVPKVERRYGHGVELTTLVRLMKEHGGIFDASVREKFAQAHPTCPCSGYLIAAANRRIHGKDHPLAPQSPVVSDLSLRDLGPMLNQYTALVRRKEVLEQELQDVENKLQLYKPISTALDNLRNVIRRVKEEETEV